MGAIRSGGPGVRPSSAAEAFANPPAPLFSLIAALFTLLRPGRAHSGRFRFRARHFQSHPLKMELAAEFNVFPPETPAIDSQPLA